MAKIKCVVYLNSYNLSMGQVIIKLYNWKRTFIKTRKQSGLYETVNGNLGFINK